jgi:hypothetical protein
MQHREKAKVGAGNVLLTGLMAMVVSLLINLGLANLLRFLFKAPDEYAPLTFLPILSGSVGGVVGAYSVFGLIRLVTRKPLLPFYIVAAVVLVASFSLPLRLLNSTSPRFVGHNMPTLIGQMVMHTVVALCCALSLRQLMSRK